MRYSRIAAYLCAQIFFAHRLSKKIYAVCKGFEKGLKRLKGLKTLAQKTRAARKGCYKGRKIAAAQPSQWHTKSCGSGLSTWLLVIPCWLLGIRRGWFFCRAQHFSALGSLVSAFVFAFPLSAFASTPDWMPAEGTVPTNPLDTATLARIESQALLAQGLTTADNRIALDYYHKAFRCDPSNTDIATLLAASLTKQGDFSEAIEVLDRAIAIPPAQAGSRPAAHFHLLVLLSTCHLAKSDYPAAQLAALEAHKADPDSFTPIALLWRIAIEQKDTPAARDILAAAATSKTRSPAYWLDYAYFLATNDSEALSTPHRRSIRETLPLIEKNANYNSDTLSAATRRSIRAILLRIEKYAAADAHTLVATAALYTRIGDLRDSLRIYRAAYKTNPEIEGLRENFVATLLALHQYRPALPILAEIIKNNPLGLKAYDTQIQIFDKLDDPNHAATAALQALALDSSSLERHIDCALRCVNLALFPQAISVLEEACRLFPNIPQLYYFLGVSYANTDQLDKALPLFEKAADLATLVAPEMLDSRFYFDYGVTAEKNKNYPLAATLLLRSIELGTTTTLPEICNYLGYMWAEQNTNLDEAETLIRRALAAQPRNPAYLDSLGWVLYKKAKYPEALKNLLLAESLLDTPDPVILDHIGDTYSKLNKPKLATQYWQRALALDPSNQSLKDKI